MTIESFKTSKTTTFLGRNGTMKCSGINMFSIEDGEDAEIDIRPVTSKNLIGRCRITITKKDIPAFIKALKKMA